MPQTAKSLYQTMHRLIRLMHRRAHYRKRMQGGLYHGQASLLRLTAQKDGASQKDLAARHGRSSVFHDRDADPA